MKKNIMIINFGTHFGGTEKYIYDIVKYINLEKYNLHICCRINTEFHNYIKHIDSKNIKVIPLNISKRKFLRGIIILKKYIKKENIEVIHNNGIFAELISSIACKQINKVSTVHGFSDKDRMDRNFLERKLFSFLERKLFNTTKVYIAVSKAIEEYLIRLGLEKEKIKIINHGIKILEKEKKVVLEEDKNEDELIIGSVGRLEKIKGYECLLRAISEVIKRGYKIRCIIVGDGKERENLLNLASELNIDNYINIVGFKENVYDYIKLMNIYVQPSLNESFGISILEAMNMSKPIIASNVGGIPEIISNNIDGLLFESRNYKDLSDKIIYLIENKEITLSLAINGRKKIINKFDIKKSIEKLENIYANLN